MMKLFFAILCAALLAGCASTAPRIQNDPAFPVEYSDLLQEALDA